MTARTRVLAATVAAAMVLAVAPGARSDAAPPQPWERLPNNEEYALLVLANKERASRGTTPLVWDDQLAEAARFKSYEMAVLHCWSHNSCNGESAQTRVDRFYDGSYTGENIAGGGSAAGLHNVWMNSPGHRANILGNGPEFGAGIVIGPPEEGSGGAGTQNYGYPGAVTIPAIPGATVLSPRWDENVYGHPTWDWELLLNYYGPAAPTRVEAFVDGVPQSLTKIAGSNTNGTWGGWTTTPGLPGTHYCKKVHFEVQRGTTVFRYPADWDIGVGYAPGCFNERQTSGGNPPPTSTSTTTQAGGAPTVVIHNPSAGGVSGMVEIRATATDNGTVKRIEVYVDDRRLVRKQGGSVVRTWSTKPVSVKPGPHTITVKAYDDAVPPNVGTASVVVTK